MTENQTFKVLMRELAGLLQSKNDQIGVLQYQLRILEERLQEAEGAAEKKGRIEIR